MRGGEPPLARSALLAGVSCVLGEGVDKVDRSSAARGKPGWLAGPAAPRDPSGGAKHRESGWRLSPRLLARVGANGPCPAVRQREASDDSN